MYTDVHQSPSVLAAVKSGPPHPLTTTFFGYLLLLLPTTFFYCFFDANTRHHKTSSSSSLVSISQGFPGGTSGKEPASPGDMSQGFHRWVRKIPRGGHGNPLQYSCLENPMARGAWCAKVQGVTVICSRIWWCFAFNCNRIPQAYMLLALKLAKLKKKIFRDQTLGSVGTWCYSLTHGSQAFQ